MRAKLKLIQSDLLSNYSFYAEAMHPCGDTVVNAKANLSRAETTLGCRVEEESGFLVLDAETFDSDEDGHGFDAKGLRVFIGDDPNDYADSIALTVQPGTITDLELRAIKVTTTDSAIKRFSPKKRNCRTRQETSFDHFPGPYYSPSKCLQDQILSAVVSECHCVPKFVDFALNESSSFAN